MHLCRITSPEQHEELDVEVGFLLRSWEIHRLHALRDSTRRNLTKQILNEVPNDAYKMFIRFLRGAAEPEVFLPTVRLNRYLHRQYCLLLSSDGHANCLRFITGAVDTVDALLTSVDMISLWVRGFNC